MTPADYDRLMSHSMHEQAPSGHRFRDAHETIYQCACGKRLNRADQHECLACKEAHKPIRTALCACGATFTPVGPQRRCNPCRFKRGPFTRKKLTPDDVRCIRENVRFVGDASDLAKQFGVSVQTISNIVHRRVWKSVR